MVASASFALSGAVTAASAAVVRRGAAHNNSSSNNKKMTSSSSYLGGFHHNSCGGGVGGGAVTAAGARHSAKSSSTTRLAASKFQKISVTSDDAEEKEGSSASAASAADADAGADAASAKPKLEILGVANEDGTQKFDDDELPDNLFDAVATAAKATDEAIQNGSLGNLVELRIDELWDPISGNVMAEAGDQLKVWEITREYTAQLCERMGPDAKVKAVFPDAGCSAMLKARWPDAPFAIASSNDRKLFEEDDAVLVFAAPDPPSLEAVTKTTKIANEAGAAVAGVNHRTPH